MSEEKIYPVSAEWAKRAFINDEKYQAMYQNSVSDPEGFWREQAKRIDWIRPFTRVKNTDFHAPVSTVAWPAAEFGAMGIEGAVRLGFRKELEALPAGPREALFERLVAEALARGQALNMASHLEIDHVIDPAETRDWLARGLQTVAGRPLGPRRPLLDTW